MTYNIEFDKSVEKFLKKCDARLTDAFLEKVEIMIHDPYDKRLDIRKLNPPLHGYGLRVGKYRFLYDVIETKILIYFYKADSR
jgi:mRNA interferase RelE/StbE